MNKNLLNQQNAVRDTLVELRKRGYKWQGYRYTNKGRYCIVSGEPNVAILLKTEPFFNFGKKFKEQGQKGVGDSINTEHLKEFVQNNVKTIYIKFRDGKLYSISLKEFLEKSFRWVQKEGTVVRSCSIHYYGRVNKEEEDIKEIPIKILNKG